MKIVNFLILVLVPFGLQAQKVLYLLPAIGYTDLTCSSDKKIGTAPGFSTLNSGGETFGIQFKLELNEKWSISSGISSGHLGWGYKVTIPKQYSNNPNGQPISAHTESILYHRFPILLTYNFRQIKWLALPKDNDKDEQLYLLSCMVQGVFGISYDRVGPLNAFDDTTNANKTLSVPIVYNDTLYTSSTYQRKSWWGSSIIGGLSFQFYKKNKPRFNLLIYYSQGIKNVVDAKVNYYYNGHFNHSVLHSKGSLFGIQLSYPIRLKSFKNKRLK